MIVQKLLLSEIAQMIRKLYSDLSNMKRNKSRLVSDMVILSEYLKIEDEIILQLISLIFKRNNRKMTIKCTE